MQLASPTSLAATIIDANETSHVGSSAVTMLRGNAALKVDFEKQNINNKVRNSSNLGIGANTSVPSTGALIAAVNSVASASNLAETIDVGVARDRAV